MGDIQLGAGNYERVLSQDPNNLEAAVYLAQARKEVRPWRKLCPLVLNAQREYCNTAATSQKLWNLRSLLAPCLCRDATSVQMLAAWPSHLRSCPFGFS
jgi:hypothetical protein